MGAIHVFSSTFHKSNVFVLSPNCRSITSIMSLLQMSSRRTPSADDLVPVLIYVLIKVMFSVFAVVVMLSHLTIHLSHSYTNCTLSILFFKFRLIHHFCYQQSNMWHHLLAMKSRVKIVIGGHNSVQPLSSSKQWTIVPNISHSIHFLWMIFEITIFYIVKHTCECNLNGKQFNGFQYIKSERYEICR